MYIMSLSRINRIIEGLKILNRYDSADTCAEHDVFMCNRKEKLKGSEISALFKLGWLYNDEYQWYFFT